MVEDLGPLMKNRSHPNHWLNRATDLHATAGAVWFAMTNDNSHQIGTKLGFADGFSLSVACHPVYDMLCGLALEVAAKAVLSSRGESIPTDHRLPSLVGLIRLKISEKERRLLIYYTEAIVWAGRYPVPLSRADEPLLAFYEAASVALTERVPNVKGIKLKRGNKARDWANFDSLWKRVIGLRTDSISGALPSI